MLLGEAFVFELLAVDGLATGTFTMRIHVELKTACINLFQMHTPFPAVKSPPWIINLLEKHKSEYTLWRAWRDALLDHPVERAALVMQRLSRFPHTLLSST